MVNIPLLSSGHQRDSAGLLSPHNTKVALEIIDLCKSFRESRKIVRVEVTVDNLNLDHTNDIRRAVPDGITQYYQAQGAANPIQISVTEQDLHPQDILLYQYGILPVLVLLLTISGIMTTGLSAAREWEDRSIKELLLSPVSTSAILAGKILAGAVPTFGVGLVVFGAGILLGWIHPHGWYIATALLIMLLAATASSGLGLAIGALFQRVQPVTLAATTASVYLFFLAGGVGYCSLSQNGYKQWPPSTRSCTPFTPSIWRSCMPRRICSGVILPCWRQQLG